MEAKSLFDKQKVQTLQTVDLSRKGSFDKIINDFLTRLNKHQDFFTLSSCSGRIVLLKSEKDIKRINKKKGCHWLICTHEPIDSNDIWNCVNENGTQDNKKPIDITSATTTLKFEPFILHVQCRNLEAAKVLHTLSLESGYRNSGLTVGKAGKIVLAVRSTHGLEVPLTDNQGKLLVDQKYIEFVAEEANAKLVENETRIKKYESKCNATIFKNLLTLENQHVHSFGGPNVENEETQAFDQENK